MDIGGRWGDAGPVGSTSGAVPHPRPGLSGPVVGRSQVAVGQAAGLPLPAAATSVTAPASFTASTSTEAAPTSPAAS